MEKNKILEIAKYVYDAEKNKYEVAKITEELFPNLNAEDAYLIQNEVIKLRERDGHNVFAPKMGLTSKAKWDQMGVDSPIVGYIFDDMIEEGNTINVLDYIHPKIEPEIAIVLKNEISGLDLTIEDVLKNTDYVLSCAEVIDSRYKNFDFTLTDVIADNTSASGAVFGREKYPITNIELDSEEVTFKLNGEVVAEGKGTAVLGHPASAIVELGAFLYQQGKVVPAGIPIMTGGITSAVLVKPGDKVEITYSNLETIEIDVK